MPELNELTQSRIEDNLTNIVYMLSRIADELARLNTRQEKNMYAESN